MANRILLQADIARAWLDLTYRITRAPTCSCFCNPTAGGAVRWSGYLGAAYVDPAWTRRRFLFVGANHNPQGLAKTPAISDYNRDALQRWASRDRGEQGDAALLLAMRHAYKSSWPEWGAVRKIFTAIRKELGIGDDAFAFVNLARCPDPVRGLDDKAITACQCSFPLGDLVLALDARVIFLAKDGPVGRSVIIPDEISDPDQTFGERFVTRYSNAWHGSRPGKPHYGHWLPEVAAKVRAFVAAENKR
jgi:hypothetical protein